MAKVFVGLSGGVDSAVAAYVLKKQGHDVVGVFIKGWEPDFLPCTGAEDRLSAMRVAAHVGIPFRTYDFSEVYKQSVVDTFVAEYRSGRTPNPDVLCNRTIKFGALWERAKEEGATCIATGHYADTNGTVLRTAKDKEKDQTYFLYTLTKDDLAHTLFPIGKLQKPEVRALARRAGLPNAGRRDSQGLCFLGHVDMHAFLKRYLPTKDGPIVDVESGVQIGAHDGAWFYTMGQHVSSNSPHRMYVVEKDVEKNVLSVSRTVSPEQGATALHLSHMSWVSHEAPTGTILAQYRYHGPLVRAQLVGATLTLEEPVQVAQGQSVVLYDQAGVLCYGGATIG